MRLYSAMKLFNRPLHSPPYTSPLLPAVPHIAIVVRHSFGHRRHLKLHRRFQLWPPQELSKHLCSSLHSLNSPYSAQLRTPTAAVCWPHLRLLPSREKPATPLSPYQGFAMESPRHCYGLLRAPRHCSVPSSLTVLRRPNSSPSLFVDGSQSAVSVREDPAPSSLQVNFTLSSPSFTAEQTHLFVVSFAKNSHGCPLLRHPSAMAQPDRISYPLPVPPKSPGKHYSIQPSNRRPPSMAVTLSSPD